MWETTFLNDSNNFKENIGANCFEIINIKTIAKIPVLHPDTDFLISTTFPLYVLFVLNLRAGLNQYLRIHYVQISVPNVTKMKV